MTGNALTRFVSKHPLRFWASVVVVLLLAFAGYTVARVATMAQSLQSLSGLTGQISDHATAGDVTMLASDLREVQRHSADAAAASNEWVVILAGQQPVFGTEISTLRVVAHVASELSSSAGPLIDLLPRLSPENIAGQDGFNIALVKNLDSAVRGLSTSVNASSAKLAPFATKPMLEELQTKVGSLTDALALAGPGLERVEPFVEALPIILGENGERTWFVASQNLTEARPSGGLLSAYVILDANKGKLDMVTQGSNDKLTAGPPVSDKVMPASLRELWGDSLKSWPSMNLSAHFPTDAEQIVGGWNSRGEQQVDGVISLGQGTVQYLAAAVGPVTVGKTTIEPANMVQYLSVDVYKEYTDPKEKDAVVAKIIGTIFDKLSSGEFNVQSLVSQALTGTNADYLQLWSTDKAEQLQIENAGLAGSLSDQPGPLSSVRVINAGGNKLDAFLQLDSKYELGACVVDAETNTASRTGTVTVTVTNNAPTSGLPPYMTGRLELEELGLDYVVGSNHSYIEVYLPVGATDGKYTQDGDDAFIFSANERNHEMSIFDVALDPGQSTTLVATWQEPAEDDEGNALSSKPILTLQPLLNEPSMATSTVEAACK